MSEARPPIDSPAAAAAADSVSDLGSDSASDSAFTLPGLLATSSPSAAESTMRTCPNCGSPLAERKCKLFCPRPGCGYFLSCADFY